MYTTQKRNPNLSKITSGVACFHSTFPPEHPKTTSSKYISQAFSTSILGIWGSQETPISDSEEHEYDFAFHLAQSQRSNQQLLINPLQGFGSETYTGKITPHYARVEQVAHIMSDSP